jgi:hypothetical protein
MKTQSASEKLNWLIAEKEAQHLEEERELKEHFHLIYESLKPINLIKNTLSEAITSPDIRNNLFNAAIGLGTGYIAKKLLIKKPDGLIENIEGNMLQLLVAAKVTDNADEIRDVIKTIFHKVTNWRRRHVENQNVE